MPKALTLIAAIIVAASFTSCDKAPNGVIKESDMVHVIADFAKAEALIQQNPALFPDDSSKLALKQSILKKYDADLAMYDSSLVWYAHNLKIYAEVHDKAIELLEKENKGKSVQAAGNDMTMIPGQQGQPNRHVFPTTGDSANIWKEPQQWFLTNAMRNGYITFDYQPDKERKRGDKYSLGLKMYNGGNSINIMLAIDYKDGCTSYTNRTAHVNGWSNYTIQADPSRVVERIYGYIKYKTNPHCVTFIDSTYLLRTHDDGTNSHSPAQHLIGPKSVTEKDEQSSSGTSIPGTANTLPARNADNKPAIQQGSFKPKPGLNKSVIPSRDISPNPNRDHMPKPPIR